MKPSLPPHPKKKHWLFGNIYYLRNDTIAQIASFCNECGPVLSLTSPINKVAIVCHPDYIKQILQDNSANYQKSLAYDILRRLLGNGLLTSLGDEWKQNRKLIQPAFHKKKLDEFVQVIVGCTKASFAKLNITSAVKDFDVSPFLNELALDIISKCMFGAVVENDAKRISTIIMTLNNLAIERLNKPITTVLFKNNKDVELVKELDNYIYKIMRERRDAGIHKDDLLQMLLDARDEETGQGMSDIQIRDEIMTIFVAGHETTACALSWMIYALGMNHDIVDKLRAEMETIDGELNFDSIFSMQYLRMVIDESLRMYPPAWSMGRRNYKAESFGKYTIPSDTNILIPIYYMHHHKDYWENPEEFNPDRFHPSIKNQINRFVYLPFGGGGRMCIGNNFALMEMSIVIFQFLKNYNFKVSEGFTATLDPLITLHAKAGIKIDIEAR